MTLKSDLDIGGRDVKVVHDMSSSGHVQYEGITIFITRYKGCLLTIVIQKFILRDNCISSHSYEFDFSSMYTFLVSQKSAMNSTTITIQ